MIIKKKILTKGMTCNSCEKIIAKQVLKLPGVKSIDIDYTTEIAEILYDDQKVSINDIKKAIEEKGYKCPEINTKNNLWGILFTVLGIICLIYFLSLLSDRIPIPELSGNMGYGLLFIVGLLTGFHCVSMCGGFVISYTAKGIKEGKKAHQLHLSYALGKIISYTLIGALFGLIGSIFAFTPALRGVIGILAGIFLIIYGLKMLNLIPGLRKFGIPSFILLKLPAQTNPFIIGLLNGLMIACGPLQAMYIMAAGTSSAIEGAKLLFIFGLGTLPVMLGFGYLTSLISHKHTSKILKASAIIVIILGVIMLNRGLALSGSGLDWNSWTNYWGTNSNLISETNSGLNLKNGYQEIYMTVDNNGYTPNKFVLKKDVPVKWIINAQELNSCNKAIQVPEYGLRFDLKQGIQTIEFTPTKTGTVSWSCWMGMIPGIFLVEENVEDNAVNQKLDTLSVPKGKTCGMGNGCGCGAR